MSDLISIDDIAAAGARIAGHVVRTPTVESPGLSAHLGVPVALKLELLQRTGSFKPRGAFHKLLGLSPAERAAGVVAVSGGNHGLAVADTAGALGIAATIVMPSSVPERAVSTCRASGAEVRLTDDMAGAFALLDELVAGGMTLVHPFDDRDVIAAQGTVGAEFEADAPGLTDVLVSIGGGALISGIAAAFAGSGVRVWGVETEGADAMSQALAAGAPVSFTPTSVVSTLSAPYVTPLTLDHVRSLVEDVLVVSDADAVRGTLTLAERAKVWAEPAAGCLVPAALRVLDRVGPDARLGLVVCGGNATTADLAVWTGRFAATPFPPREPAAA
ncbi:threonine ammonia-lyase [Pseudonocardia abyssalis]|uniref:threonine ammonia-lyase n=2 Tax=Pseudonocardia abyssalis TaxID=2792008 RepID=UPI001CF6568F|nr:threonine/serine dehydratase [Pseudonocardia abyssalis]